MHIPGTATFDGDDYHRVKSSIHPSCIWTCPAAHIPDQKQGPCVLLLLVLVTFVRLGVASLW